MRHHAVDAHRTKDKGQTSQEREQRDDLARWTDRRVEHATHRRRLLHRGGRRDARDRVVAPARAATSRRCRVTCARRLTVHRLSRASAPPRHTVPARPRRSDASQRRRPRRRRCANAPGRCRRRSTCRSDRLREVLPGKCLVDDDDTVGSGAIVAADRSTAAKGNAKALEIPRSDDSVLSGRVLDVRPLVDAQASACTRRRATAASAPRRRIPRREAHATPARARRVFSRGSHRSSVASKTTSTTATPSTCTPGWTAYMLATLRARSAALRRSSRRAPPARRQTALQPPAASLDASRPGCAQYAAHVASVQRDDGHEDDE